MYILVLFNVYKVSASMLFKYFFQTFYSFPSSLILFSVKSTFSWQFFPSGQNFHYTEISSFLLNSYYFPPPLHLLGVCHFLPLRHPPWQRLSWETIGLSWEKEGLSWSRAELGEGWVGSSFEKRAELGDGWVGNGLSLQRYACAGTRHGLGR